MIGRVVSEIDPPKVLPNNGTLVLRWRMACTRSTKNPQTGKWEPNKNYQLFIDCEVFQGVNDRFKRVDMCHERLHKGKECYVEGRLQTDEWDDKNTGKKHSKIKLVVEEIQFFDSAKPVDNEQPSLYDQAADFEPPANAPGEENIPF